MCIEFERHVFLEFFDQERVISEESLLIKYIIALQENFTFSLYLNTFEGTAVITLNHKNLHDPIFDIALKKIIKIELDKNQNKKTLNFYRQEKNTFQYQDEKLISPFLSLQVYPNVSFSYDFEPELI